MAINIIELGAKNVLEETDLRTVVDCLRDDGVVVAPTDSTYGILGLRTSAIGRISRLKKRPHDKPYLQLIYDIDIIPKEIKLPVPSFYKLAKCYWPGPLTVVLPSINFHLPGISSKSGGISYRIPDHPLLSQLLSSLGEPVIAPSANPDSKIPASSIKEAINYFSDKVDIYIDGGFYENKRFSTIISLEADEPTTVREGMISSKEIFLELQKKHILFVCTGNTCRSPLAEFYARKILPSNSFCVSSAGISSIKGMHISHYSAGIIKKNGGDQEKYLTRQLTPIQVFASDMIVALDIIHKDYLMEIFPELNDRIFLITEFIDDDKGIPDPVGGEEKDYAECFDKIRQCIDKMKERL